MEFVDVSVGGKVLEKDVIEQITTQTINLFAQYNLNYYSATYVLEVIKDKLGEKAIIKD